MESDYIVTQMDHEKNQSSMMIASIYESLSTDMKKQLEQWLPLIEDYTEQIIIKQGKKELSRRKPEILIAAAIYDAFLTFESRSNVAIRLPLLKEVFSLNQCSINSTWIKLFDGRGLLRKDFLNPVYVAKDCSLEEAVYAVIKNIRRALIKPTSEILTWIDEIYQRSLEILESIDRAEAMKLDAVLVGTSAIYAAIRNYPGKSRIQVSQRDLAEFCNHSPSMLSKVWLDLFSSQSSLSQRIL
jgi:hypothetical protein